MDDVNVASAFASAAVDRDLMAGSGIEFCEISLVKIRTRITVPTL